MQAVDHYSGTKAQIFKSRQDIKDEMSKPVPRKQQVSVCNIAVSVSDFCNLLCGFTKAKRLQCWICECSVY